MTYYHIRYNIFPALLAPIEKEEWLSFDAKQDEQQVKQLLREKCGLDVSIILHQLIGEEEYTEGSTDTMEHSKRSSNDFNNLNEWHLAIPGEILIKLNKEENENNERFRNIHKPEPLL
jgi:hypothetical protein